VLHVSFNIIGPDYLAKSKIEVPKVTPCKSLSSQFYFFASKYLVAFFSLPHFLSPSCSHGFAYRVPPFTIIFTNHCTSTLKIKPPTCDPRLFNLASFSLTTMVPGSFNSNAL